MALINRQRSDTFTLQSAATADGNGTVASADGMNGYQAVSLVNTGTGTCSVTVEGSIDGTNWFAVGVQRIDGQSAPARATGALSVGATGSGTDKLVYQVLDLYPNLRARISGTSGTLALTAKLYAVPV